MKILDMQAQREHVHIFHNALVSWKPILAGLFVTVVTYIALTALGTAIGFGAAVKAIEQEEGASLLAGGAAVWMGLSALLSLLAGSYFAARTSTFVTLRIGAAQGLVIASVFFLAMVSGIGITVGMAGAGVTSLIGKASDSQAVQIAAKPAVQATVEKAISEMPLKSDPTVVAQGLTTRLMSGNVTAATTYFVYQTGISPVEAREKVAQLSNDFKTAAKDAAMKSAKALSLAGFSFFLMVLLGVIASMVGGAMGSRENFKKPLTDEIELNTQRAI